MPFPGLEVILRPHLGRVEKACRYCLGERTSQVHLLPEADERPAQAGRSVEPDRRTARASGPLVVAGQTNGPRKRAARRLACGWTHPDPPVLARASVPREERAG